MRITKLCWSVYLYVCVCPYAIQNNIYFICNRFFASVSIVDIFLQIKQQKMAFQIGFVIHARNNINMQAWFKIDVYGPIHLFIQFCTFIRFYSKQKKKHTHTEIHKNFSRRSKFSTKRKSTTDMSLRFSLSLFHSPGRFENKKNPKINGQCTNIISYLLLHAQQDMCICATNFNPIYHSKINNHSLLLSWFTLTPSMHAHPKFQLIFYFGLALFCLCLSPVLSDFLCRFFIMLCWLSVAYFITETDIWIYITILVLWSGWNAHKRERQWVWGTKINFYMFDIFSSARGVHSSCCCPPPALPPSLTFSWMMIELTKR